MSSLPADEVTTFLDSLEVPVTNIFLFPVRSETEGLIGVWYPSIGFRFLGIDNRELSKACYIYLLRLGARQFASTEELFQAIVAERWPGWDTCNDARGT
jgi:hypothetical protein